MGENPYEPPQTEPIQRRTWLASIGILGAVLVTFWATLVLALQIFRSIAAYFQ